MSSYAKLMAFSVPMYDGTGGRFKMTELHLLHLKLHVWEGDITGCLCLVGYTANTWMARDSNVKQLSLNIQWVVVLAAK
jgi:hypothetical protein